MKEITLYKGKEKISFDENRHAFYDSKGNFLLSVTGVTGTIDKSGALMGWATNQMEKYLIGNFDLLGTKSMYDFAQFVARAKREYRLIKQEAADIGELIHQWVSEWIGGKKPEMPDNEKVVNGITAFLKFQKEHKIKWLESERFVFSKKHKFCGILDAIGKMGKELVLFDFKSSKGIYPEMFLQVAGYNIAYQEETKKKIKKKIIVKFGKEDGSFEIKELENEGRDEKAFLACLNLKRRLDELCQKK